jgi:hypothetical protein
MALMQNVDIVAIKQCSLVESFYAEHDGLDSQ